MNPKLWKALAADLKGELHTSELWRRLYATDASAYRELPAAVALPKDEEDVARILQFALQERVGLIARTAGTSLAGQVVGKGLVVDFSRYMHHIIAVDPAARKVRVQPGVIRDELNRQLRAHGLFFAPETSTANRAMIGGMVGNNACGANSLVYGSTRDHLLSAAGFMGDGAYRYVRSVDRLEFEQKCLQNDLEGQVYKTLFRLLSDPFNQQQIRQYFPKRSIRRRNTGYAIDLLLDMEPFSRGGKPFNLCTLLAGSEGTLMLLTEIELNLEPLPPPHQALVCIHCKSVEESLYANLIALAHRPTASELIDHYVLDCTKNNLEQQKNRFFVKGEPKAILLVELSDDTPERAYTRAAELVEHLRREAIGYHYPIVMGQDIGRVWSLRKAGLGLLSNMPGDAKPVPVIEDTAVDVRDLPAYIAEFNEILKEHGLYAVHYAHAGDGELHLRPILNLKTHEGQALFRKILEEVAALVKRYGGSLSGEHGDGRLRGELIPFMLGEHNYELLRQVKQAFDPNQVFNPGKIVDTPPMDTSLRFVPGQSTPQFDTMLRFDESMGIVRMAEMCNGAGECRRLQSSGGVMCPSYMATLEEKDSTRARANILREYLTYPAHSDPFAHEEIYEVMDLCLSCKGCKAECPSNVDIAKLKTEFLYQYYRKHGMPWRLRLMASIDRIQRLGSIAPGFYNRLANSRFIKQLLGIAPARRLPTLHHHSWASYLRRRLPARSAEQPAKSIVYLFVDEFTNYQDVPVGVALTELLLTLGYEVRWQAHVASGRAYLSKGLLGRARQLAETNVRRLAGLLTSDNTWLVGAEPSALLSLRDEYPDLVSQPLRNQAKSLAQKALLLDEFIAQQADSGLLSSAFFKALQRPVWVHGHCHQKALSSMTYTRKALNLIPQLDVRFIPSGCCGMAGAFGYEREHYDLSMKIGELVLFPYLRQAPEDCIVLASGTSCRHQISDGTGRKAYHLAEVLYQALHNQTSI